MVLSRSARQAPAYPTVSPRFTSRTVSTVVSSVIDGLEPVLCARSHRRTAKRRTARGPAAPSRPAHRGQPSDAGGVADAGRAGDALRSRFGVGERRFETVDLLAVSSATARSSARARCVITRSSSAGTVSARSRASAAGNASGPKPQAVHARVDLDPDDESVGAAMRLEQLELQRIVDHELEAMMRGLGELLGAEHAFEQHDGRAHAGGCAAPCLLRAAPPRNCRHRRAPAPSTRARDRRHWP